MAITTDLTTLVGQVRLKIADTTEPALFTDAELEFLLDDAGGVDGAVSAAVSALVIRFSRDYDVTVDGQSFDRSQVAERLAERAKELVGIADQTLVTAYVTRIDGYSDDVSALETGASSLLDGYDLDPDHDIPA